ncbi:MAG: hypothetical protein A3J24_00715 [Deltaproteobacteria bacterium RIFCSPLOWO2_02_FULL_53_8]|nr:MAG: hypothetical protein A3J24_00715 [Deltaproteobacteria bacterium RIFCSPLOWO2_02_FULL_53_8]
MRHKKVAIVQSNYIPWKGYFDMIAAVDEFILYDDVQFTKNDWRNRNQIKTPNGVEWLSIPVGQAIDRRIRDVVISNPIWREKHWRTLEGNYRRAPFFNEIASIVKPLYRDQNQTNLSATNREFIEVICNYLGICTKISNNWDYDLVEGKTERLVDLCKQSGADEYISGPAAMAYLDTRQFALHGIKLTWFNYENYPVYPQLWGEFTHGVSALDLLFNCGKNASAYMKYVQP